MRAVISTPGGSSPPCGWLIAKWESGASLYFAWPPNVLGWEANQKPPGDIQIALAGFSRPQVVTLTAPSGASQRWHGFMNQPYYWYNGGTLRPNELGAEDGTWRFDLGEGNNDIDMKMYPVRFVAMSPALLFEPHADWPDPYCLGDWGDLDWPSKGIDCSAALLQKV